MGDRLPRRMTDLGGSRGHGRPEDKTDIASVEAAASLLSSRSREATPTTDSSPRGPPTSSRLSMLLFPRVEKLEDTVRSVKKDLGRVEDTH